MEFLDYVMARKSASGSAVGGSSGSSESSSSSSGGSSGGGKVLVPYPVTSFIAKIPNTIINAVTVPYKVPIPVLAFEEATV